MRTIWSSLIVLTICVLASSAAATQLGTRTCLGSGAMRTCVWTWGEAPEMAGTAKIIRVPQPTTAEEITAAAEREREWTAICDPRIVLDQYGVSRYTYGSRCPNGVPVGQRP